MSAKNEENSKWIYRYEEVLAEQFKKIDASNDGSISFGEFVKQMNSFGYQLSETGLKKSFAAHDTDKDGKISLQGTTYKKI